jgi:hypothetical protein
MCVTDEKARDFYEAEAVECGWSKAQLERQIQSSLYQRILAHHGEEGLVAPERERLPGQPSSAREVLRLPLVLELPRNAFIVFPKRGAAIFTNKVNIIYEPAVIDPNLMGWIPNRRANPVYLAHVLKLRGLDDIADVPTVPQINNKHIAPMMFPVPPAGEQGSIVEHLRTRLHSLDLLLDKAKQQIYLLQERRTALISAAVTGKIDVRNWQPPEVEATREVA